MPDLPASPSLWPRPAEVNTGHEVVWLDEHVEYELHPSPDTETNQCMKHIQEEFIPQIMGHALVPEKLHPLRADFEPDPSVSYNLVETVVMRCEAVGDIESKESYSIKLTCDDGIRVECTFSSYNGGWYALQTLRQLFYNHSRFGGRGPYTPFAPFEVKDVPRFEHRGLNLDLSRNRISPKAVMRTIDGMASAKLNKLHLHATDSQSWPIEIPALPELAAKGAYHHSHIWSARDLERVQWYGRARAVEVFLEVDMPGHTASIHHSHPELIVGYDQRPWEPWAAEPPSGQLKLNCPKVINFLKTLLADLLPRCSKYSQHFHIGADEINTKIHELDPGVQSSDRDVIRPFLQSLVDGVMTQITEAGLTPIAWEELLLDWDIKLPQSTIIQVWRSHENVSRAAQRGHRVIFGPSTHWYLDGGQGNWADPDPNKDDSTVKPPFLDWCDPYKNWRQICSYDPFEGVPSELHHLLLGGETSLWCELTDEVTLDSKLWPRVAAAAETLWAGPQKVDEQMTRRLAEFRERLVLQGIGAGVVQMEWSLRNPGGSLS